MAYLTRSASSDYIISYIWSLVGLPAAKRTRLAEEAETTPATNNSMVESHNLRKQLSNPGRRYYREYLAPSEPTAAV
jgi:hypothetical protein